MEMEKMFYAESKQELGTDDNINVILHELGNIVMLMNLSIDKIEENYENINKNKYFKDLKEDTRQIVCLINSSKENEKIFSLKKENINIELFIKNIVEKYKKRCEKNDIKLKIYVEKSCKNKIVNIDKFKMSRVFENLIINSIEELELCNICDREISININCKESRYKSEEEGISTGSEKIRVSIKNNGRVIESSKIKEIFKPYITNKKNGNGIGLAFCEKIVKLHGGNISVISNKDTGTVFSVDM